MAWTAGHETIACEAFVVAEALCLGHDQRSGSERALWRRAPCSGTPPLWRREAQLADLSRDFAGPQDAGREMPLVRPVREALRLQAQSAVAPLGAAAQRPRRAG